MPGWMSQPSAWARPVPPSRVPVCSRRDDPAGPPGRRCAAAHAGLPLPVNPGCPPKRAPVTCSPLACSATASTAWPRPGTATSPWDNDVLARPAAWPRARPCGTARPGRPGVQVYRHGFLRSPAHPQGGRYKGGEEDGDADEQQVEQALRGYADDAERKVGGPWPGSHVRPVSGGNAMPAAGLCHHRACPLANRCTVPGARAGRGRRAGSRPASGPLGGAGDAAGGLTLAMGTVPRMTSPASSVSR